MEKMDEGQIYNEDPLAIYRPFLDELNRILENVGEAATLQEFARDPRSARILQGVYRVAFGHARDISKPGLLTAILHSYFIYNKMTIYAQQNSMLCA
jgi:hypothetical protein